MCTIKYFLQFTKLKEYKPNVISLALFTAGAGRAALTNGPNVTYTCVDKKNNTHTQKRDYTWAQ